MKRVVIIGGGYGGIKTALELGNVPGLAVTLLTDSPVYHTYTTASAAVTLEGGMGKSIIVAEKLAYSLNCTVHNDAAESLDARRQRVIGESGKSYDYDYLVCATGAVHFAPKRFSSEPLPHIYAPEGVIAARSVIRAALKVAQPTIAIIGAGWTGVELAGSLAAKYPAIETHVYEVARTAVPAATKSTRHHVAQCLMEHNVIMHTNTRVEKASPTAIQAAGSSIAYTAVLWAGGYMIHPLFSSNHSIFSLTKQQKVAVNQHCMASPNVFVIGDAAAINGSGMAQCALQSAVYVAAFIRAQLHGQTLPPFKPLAPTYVSDLGGLGWFWSCNGQDKMGWQAKLYRKANEKIIANNFI